jgi:hypothetical protein
MVGSRTIKALVALLVSMTVGAGVLMMLEVAPAAPRPEQLTALTEDTGSIASVIRETSVPLQPIKWRHVVIHSSGDAGFMEQCHFVIAPDGAARRTELWKAQAGGDHIYVPGRDFRRDSIGICLEGSFSYDDPTIPQRQFDALVELCRSLQRAFRVTADRVYLESDLVVDSTSPGDTFPSGQFNAELLRRLP